MDLSIEKRQLWAWLLAAMIAPMAAGIAGQPWFAAGITAVACMVLYWTQQRLVRVNTTWPVWFCVLQWGWTMLSLSRILGYLPMTWPQAMEPKLAGVLLLLAALWAVRSGAEVCARAGTVLFWAAAALIAIVWLAALKDVRLENLTPQFQVPDSGIFFILLIPCMTVLLPRRERGSAAVPAVLIALAAFAIPCLTAGVLSPKLSMTCANAFYEMSRTVSLSGAVQRFEALVSAGLTISWFLLLCMFLSVSGSMAKKLSPRWEWLGEVAGAIGALILYLCDLRISGTVMAAGGILFWGLLPVLTQGIDIQKKM